MAKRKPTLTLMEMEMRLGYNVDSLNYPDDSMKRFYSDLRPVSNSVYERTKKEFEEYEKQRHREDFKSILDKFLPELDVAQTIAHGQDTISLTRRSHVGLYRFTIDIRYGFGFVLPLLFTNDEAFKTMSVAKLQPNTIRSVATMFFKLPKEIRDKIYIFALPRGKWKLRDNNNPDELSFARGVGDPSGFYFPLSKDLSILRVNRQMRQEALSFAYRRTVFHLDDMDDLIKLLIAVGEFGRANIESLELTWESKTDSECKWHEAPDFEGNCLILPKLHVVKCVQLLKQCKRLRFLRLYFESDAILNLSSDAYKVDPGICGLCSVRGIETVEIWDLGHKPLEQCGLVKWLKEEMESSREKGEDGKAVGRQDCIQ